MSILQKKIPKKQEKSKSLQLEEVSISPFKLLDNNNKLLDLKNMNVILIPILIGGFFLATISGVIIANYYDDKIEISQMGNLIGYGLVLAIISLVGIVVFKTQIKKIKTLFLAGLILLLVLFFVQSIFSNYIENQIIRVSEYHDLMSSPGKSALIQIELELERLKGIIPGDVSNHKINLSEFYSQKTQVESAIDSYDSLTFEKNSFGEVLASETKQQRMYFFTMMKNSLDGFTTLVEEFNTRESLTPSQIDGFLVDIENELEPFNESIREAKKMELIAQQNSQNQINQFSTIMTFSNVLFFGFVFLSTGSISIVIRMLFKKNIETLKETTSKISKGMFDTRINLKETTEFTEIGKYINEMAKALSYFQEKSLKNEKQSTIGEMSARISHDIRNPLSALKGDVDLIKLGKQPDEKQVKRMERSIKRIQHQIDEVLEYVRLNPIEYSKFYLDDQIEAVLENIQVPSGVKISISGKKIPLFADIRQTEIMLINLILNSIQEIGDSGTIDIKLSETTSETIIKIIDSGPGIDLEPIEKIFEPLVTTKQQGTGLGLVSVKNIVDKHCGKISVENNPTTFTIILPKEKTE